MNCIGNWVGEILRLVNQLLEYAGRRERVSKLEQCNCELIYSLYCKLFNEQVTDRPAGMLLYCITMILMAPIARRCCRLSTYH